MNKNRERGKIDWMITLLPLTIIIALCITTIGIVRRIAITVIIIVIVIIINIIAI